MLWGALRALDVPIRSGSMNRRRCTIWGGFNPGRAECKSSNRPHEDLKCLVAVCGILVDSTVALGEGLSSLNYRRRLHRQQSVRESRSCRWTASRFG